MESKPPLPISADSYVSTHSTALERASSQALVGDENPLNWSAMRKWPLSIIVIMMSATMGYYSGVHAASIQAVADFYGCSVLASTSAVSFFLLGFAIGPLFFAPLSEMLGRNPILRVAFGLFVISNIGDALAPNIETLLFFRFLGGLLGAPTGTESNIGKAYSYCAKFLQSPTQPGLSLTCGLLTNELSHSLFSRQQVSWVL